MAQFRAVTIAHTDKGNAGHGLHTAFDANDDVQMIALSDPNSKGRAKLAAECEAERTYANYEEMLDQERPDIVCVARHWFDESRVQQFLAAVESGARGIYLEKPVAAWPDQAHRMLEASEAGGVAVVLAHRGREHPMLARLKQRAASGEWGPLVQVRAQDKGDHRAGAEDAMIHATHVLDVMLFIVGVGPISCWGSVMHQGRPATRADAAPLPVYDAGPTAGDRIVAGFHFPNGVLGSYESLPVDDGTWGSERLGCDFYFQQAIVTARGQPGGRFHLYPHGGLFPHAELGAWTELATTDWPQRPIGPVNRNDPAWRDFNRASMHHSNHVNGRHLVDWIRTGTAEPSAPTIRDGVTAVEMIVGAIRSHLERRCIDLPLRDRRNPWLG